MSYRIRFEGCGTTTVRARSHPDALAIAAGLLRRGRKNVVIAAPDGSVVRMDEQARPVSRPRF